MAPSARWARFHSRSCVERFHRSAGTQRGQPGVEVALHAVLEHDRAIDVLAPDARIVAADRRWLLGQVGRIDDHRPGLSENGDGLAHDVALPGLVHERRARNADTGALQSACVQMTGVVTVGRSWTRPRRRIVRVRRRTFEHAEEHCGVRHRSRHRSGGVLIRGNRDDAVPADPSDRRLDPHNHRLV